MKGEQSCIIQAMTDATMSIGVGAMRMSLKGWIVRPATNAFFQVDNDAMPGETTLASRKIPIGSPASMRACNSRSVSAFHRPYSLLGETGASARTCGLSPSKT